MVVNRLCTAQLKGKYLVACRTAQGRRDESTEQTAEIGILPTSALAVINLTFPMYSHQNVSGFDGSSLLQGTMKRSAS
jgi:hypothetical protein